MISSSHVVLRVDGIAERGGAAVLLIAALVIVAVVLLIGRSVMISDKPSHSDGVGDGSAKHANANVIEPVWVRDSEQGSADARALPPETHPALRAFVDPQASERLPADFQYQVDVVSDPVETAAVVAVLCDRQESDTIRHEAANLLRRSGYANLEQVLIACLQHPEEQERFRSWAVQHLFMVFEEQSQLDPHAARKLLQPLLQDPQPAVRREAL